MTIEVEFLIVITVLVGIAVTTITSMWFTTLLKVIRNMERMVWILDQIRLEGLPVQAPDDEEDEEGEPPEPSEDDDDGGDEEDEDEDEDDEEEPPSPLPAPAPPPPPYTPPGAQVASFPWGTKYTSISVVRDGQKVENATVDPAELDAILREVQDLAGGFYGDAHSERMSALMKRVRDMTDKVSKAGEAVPSAPTEAPSP
jgi:hypothetical protein